MVIQREGFYGYPTGNKLKAAFTVGTTIFQGCKLLRFVKYVLTQRITD